MGFFTRTKSVFKKSEASEALFQLMNRCNKFRLIPEKNVEPLSRALIERVWESAPDIYDGKFGQRPHKYAVVASALYSVIETGQEDGTNQQLIELMCLCLSSLLDELTENGILYPFTDLDKAFISKIKHSFEQYIATMDSAISKEYNSWGEWYIAFVDKCCELNPQISTDENGKSIIDFIDHQPLRRAFNDGVSPESVACAFAPEFDIRTFGR